MQYGLSLPNTGSWGNVRIFAELARLAEDAGWDGIFLEDYIVWQSRQDVSTHDPWIMLAAMAMTTERIRLGTQVTPLARRRPWKVAREAVTLDHLSNGRLILGVGLGDTGESVLGDSSFTHFGELMGARERAHDLAFCGSYWPAHAIVPESHLFDRKHIQRLGEARLAEIPGEPEFCLVV